MPERTHRKGKQPPTPPAPQLTAGNGIFRWRYALIIFVVALGYRGLYLFEASRQVGFDAVYMDEEYHVTWARGVAFAEWPPPYDQLRDIPFFRAPLYPYFLAGLFALGVDNLLVVRVLQLLIGAWSCVLAYGLTAKCFSQRVGVITGLLCACYWVLAYFDGELLLPVLLVFLLLLGFYLAFSAAERRSVLLAGAAGLVFGLFAITRPNILVFFPFLLWWALRLKQVGTGRQRLAFTLLLGLGCALPPALVTLRNRVVGDDWVVVASQGGVNFYIGNNPESNGMQAVVPGTRQTWWGGYEDTVALAEQASGRPLQPSEVSRYWFGKAFAYIRSQPGHWMRLTLRKALALIGDVELINNEPYESRRRHYWSLSCVPLSFAPVFGLFLVALPQMLRRRCARDEATQANHALKRGFVLLILQFLAVYALTIIAFFVTGRYRVPLLPFVMMGAALTLVTLAGLIRTRAWMKLAVMLAVSLGLIAILKVDYFHARQATRGFAELTEAQDLLEAGDLSAAIQRLEAVRRQRSVRAPEVYTTLTRAYLQRNRPGDKKLLFEVVQDGLHQYPTQPELLWYATLSHFERGELAQGRGTVDRYLLQEPTDLRALYLAFQIARSQGDPAGARRYLTRGQAENPQDPFVLQMQREADRLPSAREGG